MNILPPLPSYESCHPIVVHFPIALLLVSPLFVVLALLWRKQAFAMNVAAAVLLSLGTAGAFLATSTGEAAEEAAEQTLAPKAVLEQHEELAELASKLFVGVSVLSIGVAGLSWWLRERPRAALAWGGGILLLAGQPSSPARRRPWPAAAAPGSRASRPRSGP